MSIWVGLLSILMLTTIALAQPAKPPVPTEYWTEVTVETTFQTYSGSDTVSGTLYFDHPNNRMLTKTESADGQYEFEYTLKLEDEGTELTYYTSQNAAELCYSDCCRGYFNLPSTASPIISTAPEPTSYESSDDSSNSYNSWWSSASSWTSDTFSIWSTASATWWTTGSTLTSWYNDWSTWSTGEERKEFERNFSFEESFQAEEDPLDWIPERRRRGGDYMELANPSEKKIENNFSKTFLSRLFRNPTLDLDQITCSAHLINLFSDLQRARADGFCYDGKSMANLWVNYNNDEFTVYYCIRTNGVPLYVEYDYVAYTTYIYFESWEEGPQPDNLFVVPPICDC